METTTAELPFALTEESAKETRACSRCKGTGTFTLGGFESCGQVYPEVVRACYCCNGKKAFEAPVLSALVDEIKGRKGLRSSRPASNRAYYVWRMARFHGGVDVTMPITAISCVSGDPFVKELDLIAEAAARVAFGTDRAAAHRWGMALGHIQTSTSGLPATAYPGGPVVTAEKPAEEACELR
jgi:hypothetical protein